MDVPRTSRVETYAKFEPLGREVRFKIVQQGEPKMFVLDASDGTVDEILDYARARGANVSHLKRRMWRYL
jgi:hypothetical protein